MPRHRRRNFGLVSVGLDLLATALSVAQGRASLTEDTDRRTDPRAAPGDRDGLDLLPLLDGARGRREVVIETAFEAPAGGGSAGRSLITDQYKYVLYSWGAHREQLFDLEADPGELRNLAAESALDPLLEQLRGRLLAWCLRTEDTRFLKRLVLPPDTPAEVHDEIFAVPY